MKGNLHDRSHSKDLGPNDFEIVKDKNIGEGLLLAQTLKNKGDSGKRI
jgi:hypothetical protein